MKILLFLITFFIFDRCLTTPILISNSTTSYKNDIDINISNCILKSSSKISLILCDSFFILIRNSQLEKFNIQLKKYVIYEKIVFFDLFSNYALVSTITGYFLFSLDEKSLLRFLYIRNIERNYSRLKGLEVDSIVYLIGFFEIGDNIYFDTYLLNLDYNYYRTGMATFSKSELKISDISDINFFYNNFHNELEIFMHSLEKITILKSNKAEFYFKFSKEIYFEENFEKIQNNEILLFNKNGELKIYYYRQYYNDFILVCKYRDEFTSKHYYLQFLFQDATNRMNMNQIGVFFPDEKSFKLISILNSNTSAYTYPICEFSENTFNLPDINSSIAFAEISDNFNVIMTIQRSYFVSFPLCIESSIQPSFQTFCPRFSSQTLNQCEVNKIYFYDRCLDEFLVQKMQSLCSDFSDCYNCSQVTSCEWYAEKNICEKSNNSNYIPYFLKKCPLLPICVFHYTKNISGIIIFDQDMSILEQNSFCNWVIIASYGNIHFEMVIMIEEGFIKKEDENKVELLVSFYNSNTQLEKKEFRKIPIPLSSPNEYKISETFGNVFEIYLTFYSKIFIDPTKFKIIYISTEKKSFGKMFFLTSLFFIICVGLIMYAIIGYKLYKNRPLSPGTRFSSLIDTRGLIKHSFEVEMMPYQQSNCPICLENLNENKMIVETVCKHVFHERCFKIWNKSVERGELKCPICRTSLYI